MKSVRMFLTGAIVIAIVGASLAFTKSTPNLLKCDSNNVCASVKASNFDPGNATELFPATDYYTSNTSTVNIICFKSGSQTQGCSSDNHPDRVWVNN